MIALLSWVRMISLLAKLYVVTFLLVLMLTVPNSGLSADSATAALRGGVVIDLLLLVFLSFGWRKLWQWFPSLNRVLFPDLNGVWDVEIRWNWRSTSGVAIAQAYVKQDFARISMHLRSENSESDTLVAIPKKDAESGLPLLYYMFRNTPKFAPGSEATPYEGAASLRIDYERLDLLKGNYFTSAGSKGVFVMTKSLKKSPSWSN